MAGRVLAIVTFPARALPSGEMRRVLDEAVPRYLAVPGLHRKYFLHAPGVGGGAYEWASREHAERFYDAAWSARIAAAAGAPPEIAYFAIAAVADAERGHADILD